jgi:methylthioribose-1-phosphate isomerase
MGTLEAIRYSSGKLEILDQLLLPHKTQYIEIRSTKDGWQAIRDMQVRGAPAIAIVGVLSIVTEIYNRTFASVAEICDWLHEQLDYLVSARPTAVNMADSRCKLLRQLDVWKTEEAITPEEVQSRFIKAGEQMQADDVTANIAIGRFGADSIEKLCGTGPFTLLTHCNTGSLATAGFGTALGIVRTLYARGHLAHCYCTETRPYNQGARLTAYELVHDGIPSTLLCDDMVAAAMSRRGISAVVTGADRIAANGDTANKIGTYQIAIIAQYHSVPFYIVAPSTSVDLTIASGSEIVIEERPHCEMTSIAGVKVAATGINCWNPAFDVTPASLITGGIVTEFGVFRPAELEASLRSVLGNNTLS